MLGRSHKGARERQRHRHLSPAFLVEKGLARENVVRESNQVEHTLLFRPLTGVQSRPFLRVPREAFLLGEARQR